MSDWKHIGRNVTPRIWDTAADTYRDWRRLSQWHLSREGRTSVRRMRGFRNRHVEQRCFIIGNGPSLNQMDLSPLRHELTFGLNRIYLLFPKIGFHTTYLVSVNRLVIEQCASELAGLPMPKFFSWATRQHIPCDDRTIFLRSSTEPLGFSHDPSHSIHEGATVTYVAMQLAYYMGFKQVILIGVDHNFVTGGTPHKEVISGGADPNHFSPEYFGKGFRWQLPDLETSELGYRLARDAFSAAGREIVDATKGGKLTIFPKVDYETLF